MYCIHCIIPHQFLDNMKTTGEERGKIEIVPSLHPPPPPPISIFVVAPVWVAREAKRQKSLP